MSTSYDENSAEELEESVNIVESGLSIDAALQQEDAPSQREVINSEVASLHQHRLYRLVVGQIEKLISTKFVQVKKQNDQVVVQRYKERLVAQGFFQRPGLDFDAESTYASTENHTVLRLLLAKATDEKLSIWQCYVRTAYLEEKLDLPVLVRLPCGMVFENDIPAFHLSGTDAGPIVHLIRSLPSLRQSPSAQHDILDKYLLSINMTCCKQKLAVYA